MAITGSPILLKLIMKLMKRGESENEVLPDIEEFKNQLSSYAKSIYEQLGSYTGIGMWLTTNTVRKKQFNQLMQVLEAASGEVPQYMAMLHIIWEVQKSILESDKDTTWNGKGYSRLYNLTLDMFTKISRDMLMDANVSAQDKQALYLLMAQQTATHLQSVCERLPSGGFKDRLSQFATRYKGDSQDLAELKGLLLAKEAKKKHIPSHLHYAVNNLLYSAEMAINTPLERDKLAKRLR